MYVKIIVNSVYFKFNFGHVYLFNGELNEICIHVFQCVIKHFVQ